MDMRIDTAIRQMFVNPRIKVDEMSMAFCLSRKQFEREFYSMVGMNPKEYKQVFSFRKALAYMQNGSDTINQVHIALESGYSDQSHFICEFKKISGYTPVTLLESTNPYPDLFTNPI